jgi:hypothetical protein
MGAHAVPPINARAALSARRAIVVVLLLGATIAVPASAQQPRDSTRAVRADTVSTASPVTSVVGPRREVRFQAYRPQLQSRSEARAAAQEGAMHTFTLSTLALSLMGVIVLLLIL